MCKRVSRNRSSPVTQGKDEPGETVTSGCTKGLDMILHVKHRLEKEGQEGNLGEILAIR